MQFLVAMVGCTAWFSYKSMPEMAGSAYKKPRWPLVVTTLKGLLVVPSTPVKQPQNAAWLEPQLGGTVVFAMFELVTKHWLNQQNSATR